MQGSPKKWPAAVAGGVALLMAVFVLPNPFKIPQNNPTASAEYAPVPGKTDDATNANFGETAIADSSGIGSGNDGEGLAPGSPPPPPPPQFKPRNKNCVGNPPRQTEDPLSPPCVPFFEGDNGGVTFKGVTKDAIKVVFYNDSVNVKGDLNQPWKPSDEAADHRASVNGQDTYIHRTIKALLRYFQDRYQTYGRRVKVWGQISSGGLTSSCAARNSDAETTVIEQKPFAAVHFGDGGQCYMRQMATKHSTPVFGLNSDVPRKLFADTAPYVWGFYPDQETESSLSASMICRTLYLDAKKKPGAKARFTNDPALNGVRRKFGLLYPTNSARGPESQQLAELLMKRLEAECGLKKGDWLKVATFANDGKNEAASIMQNFKSQNVTTVICYCVPVLTELTVGTMQNAAKSINYTPEWYWDATSRMFRAAWNQQHGDPAQSSFGMNYHWRNASYTEQVWYKAYAEQEPGTSPNTRFGFDIYHLFLNLFEAIQAAGPNLTPESVERGMFTFNYQNQSNPFVPTGGYGPYGPKAIGPYTFVDTAMGWWWDPSGTPPGGRSGEGCVRVMNQGLRYYPGEWPLGDAALFKDDAPCSQDDVKVVDTNSTDLS